MALRVRVLEHDRTIFRFFGSRAGVRTFNADNHLQSVHTTKA